MAVVGNDDGAHKAGADIFQALNDVACFLASSEREPDPAVALVPAEIDVGAWDGPRPVRAAGR
ncbi:hypothetical protein [Streptomyces sp. NPDC058066]|uniref:hypothetical protein n=1 Tax=Streptomyces sp. NPDC058066 TaxID=3346323 RepID=UPI0036E72BFB